MAECTAHAPRPVLQEPPRFARVPVAGRRAERPKAPAADEDDGDIRKLAARRYCRTYDDALTRREVLLLLKDCARLLPTTRALTRVAAWAPAAAKATPRAFYGGAGRPTVAPPARESVSFASAIRRLNRDGDVSPPERLEAAFVVGAGADIQAGAAPPRPPRPDRPRRRRLE